MSDFIDMENVTASSITVPVTFALVQDLNNFNITSSPFFSELEQKPLSMVQAKSTKYVVNLSALAKNHPLLMTANFWFYRYNKNDK